MTNSLKGIAEKISICISKLFKGKQVDTQETYEQYRQRQQFSSVKISPRTKRKPGDNQSDSMAAFVYPIKPSPCLTAKELVS